MQGCWWQKLFNTVPTGIPNWHESLQSLFNYSIARETLCVLEMKSLLFVAWLCSLVSNNLKLNIWFLHKGDRTAKLPLAHPQMTHDECCFLCVDHLISTNVSSPISISNRNRERKWSSLSPFSDHCAVFHILVRKIGFFCYSSLE